MKRMIDLYQAIIRLQQVLFQNSFRLDIIPDYEIYDKYYKNKLNNLQDK